MKNLSILLLGLFFFFDLSAQIVNPKKVRFGKISDTEMELSNYELDPDAEAVIIFDEGRLRMELDPTSNSFEYVLDRHIRIKILKPSGTDYANFKFLLESSSTSSAKEEIMGVKGATYNMVNGKNEETKLSKDAIFDENLTEDLRRYTISFPQVKEGSLIELKYTLKSDFLFNLPTWYFQREIPTDYTLFEAIIPEYYSYNLDMQGYASSTLTENVVGEGGMDFVMLKVDTRGGRPSTDFSSSSAGKSSETRKIDFTTRTYRWVAQQVPPLQGEPFAPSSHNFFFRVNFELASTNFPGQIGQSYTRSWEDVSKTYQRAAGTRPYRNPKNNIEELAQGWATGAEDEISKVINIYEGIKQQFAWNDQFQISVDETPGKLISLKEGTSAEINYLLLGALRSQGITANPVLLSTREHGYLSLTRPSLTQFNHIMVLVQLPESGQSFLLDATRNDIPAGLLPAHDLVGKGRLLTEEASDWVNIAPPAKEKTAVQCKLKLSKDGTLSGDASIKMSDYAAVEMRRQLNDEAALSAHLQEWLGANLSEVATTGLDNIYEDLAISAQLDASDLVMQQNNFYYIPAVLAKKFAENPLKAEERVLPIDLITPREYINVTQLSIEEGLQADELPESAAFSMEGGKARYSIKYVDLNGNIQIVEKLSIKDPIYNANEYAALKNFLDLVIENQQASLVIKGE